MPRSRIFATTGHMVATRFRAANWHILRAALYLASAALLLRVGGIVNQVIVSASFGAGAAMDAYFVAVAFPLLMIQLLSSAIEAAVVPIYTQLRIHSSKEAASRLFSTLLNCLVLGAIPLTLALLFLRRPLVFFSAPGLDAARLNQAVALTPILYLIIPVSLVTGLLESVLHAEGEFGWPAYAGLLVPLTTAILTLMGGKTWGIAVLCAGSLLGTALQLLVVCLRVRWAGLRYQPLVEVHNPYLGAILRAAWPVLLGALLVQGGPLVDQVFASTLPAGNISALNYALKLVSVVIGVVFVSSGRALLPYLARLASPGDPEYRAFKETLRFYLWGIGLCTLTLSCTLFWLGHPLVQFLFQRGAFSAADTRNTVTLLTAFAPGLLPMALNFLLTRAFNSLGETRVPLFVALVSIGANALLDALFAHFWQALGIALATSAVSWATSVLLLVLLRWRIGKLSFWRVPVAFRVFWTRFTFARLEYRRARQAYWASRYVFSSERCQRLFYAGITLFTLVIGASATARNAFVTLHVVLGMLLVLCFLRVPYLLLLGWASINVCLGSSLAIFNGNNLDMVLVIPFVFLLPSLPWREIMGRVPGLIWLALYLGWVLLGVGLSPLDTRAFLTFWLTMLAAVGMSVLTIVFVTTHRRLLGLVDTLLVTALLVALYGLYGFVTHQRGEVDPETALFRITSLFTQATTFAFYLSLVIPLAFYRCLLLRGARRLIGSTVAFCLLLALLLTFTRGAYVGVLLSVLIMVLCLAKRARRVALSGGLIVFCGLALYLNWSGDLPLLARFFNGDISTLNGRVYLWLALLSHFQVTHWLGGGLQSSDQLLAYLHVGNAGQGVIGTAPHSLFLGTLYDHGIIGLLLLCLAFLSLGGCLLKGIRRSNGEQRMLYAVALSILVSMLLQSLGSRDLWIQAAGVSFWIVVALPFAHCWYHARTFAPEQRDNKSGSFRAIEGTPDNREVFCSLPV